MKHCFSLIILLLAILFSACDTNRLYERNHAIKEDGWYINEKPKFFVTVEDTITQHDFYINIRNTGLYRYSNLFLFINTEFPNGKSARDTIECILADDKGKWLGNGSGDLYDNRILFKKNVRFPAKGVYKFTFEQAMRMNPITEIKDVGLRIEKQ